MTFAFSDADKASFPVAFMFGRLGASRTSNYASHARQVNPTPQLVADVELAATMRENHAGSPGTVGVPRVPA